MKDRLNAGKKSGKKPPVYEILAPAGRREALEAAVQNGADAVYLSGKEFGARKFAANFSKEELLSALDYCHERGVSVYVTVNTLLFNQEFEKLKETLDYYYGIGVDAVIVQDMGVLSFIRRTYPEMDIHCSTQMSVQTVEDIRFLESLGVKRVVLGREMSLEEIRRAKKETDVELEVFIHGALCISVSGQCLMSSMIGGRSGNRGSCAQPCRQKYTLYNEDSNKEIPSEKGDYLLSPKDLAAAENIAAVIEAGGYSLKIEGRMKKPEYVATVVRVYRQLIRASYGDELRGKDVEKALEDLTIFNRGFTKGHLFDDPGKDFMSLKIPGNRGIYIGKVLKQDRSSEKIAIALERDLSHNDEIQLQRREGTVGGRVERLEDRGKVVKHCSKGKTCEVNFKHRVTKGEPVYKTFDEVLMKEARQTYHKEFLEIPITGEFTFREGLPLRGMLTDGKIKVLMESTEVPEKARGKSLTIQGLQKQLSKLGGTPYNMRRIDVDLQGELFIPARAVNELRRDLVEKLSEERIQRYRRDFSSLSLNGGDIIAGETDGKEESPKRKTPVEGQESGNPWSIELTYSAANLEQLDKLLELQGKTIYYKELETLKEAFEMVEGKNFSGDFIPEVYGAATGKELDTYKKIISKERPSRVLVQSFGHIPEFEGVALTGDLSLNVVNDRSYEFYRRQGVSRITLSPELTLAKIKEMKFETKATEIFGYGHLPVMGLKHCPISTVMGLQKHCNACKEGDYSLVDRMGEHFPLLRRNHCYVELYHCKKHFLLEDLKVLEQAGIGYFRLNFVKESSGEVEKIVKLHRRVLKEGLTDEIKDLLRWMKKEEMTKGHLYQGVE
ncbi:U32 family peptidase [Isachenkonia alkalipeptolytica]|nr:U32 family peptidase [Isachenkonia alkalipeptolytica]